MYIIVGEGNQRATCHLNSIKLILLLDIYKHKLMVFKALL